MESTTTKTIKITEEEVKSAIRTWLIEHGINAYGAEIKLRIGNAKSMNEFDCAEVTITTQD